MEIPAAYRAALADVCSVFPGSMLAGGAMRDLDNGRPVKDLDVFCPNVGDLDTFKARVGTLASTKLLGVMGGYENWATSECVGVLDVESPYGPVQLIGLSTGPETILSRIDFGICQIGFDGEQVIRTEAYEADKAAKTFTIVRSDDEAQLDRSYRRWDRLREKYPDWRLAEPWSVDQLSLDLN